MGARGWNFRVWSCPCDALPGDMSPLLLRPPNVPLSFSSQTPDPKSQNSSQSLDLTFAEYLLRARHLACVISFHPMKCV